uniref:hypothetical protein n=1 Tax=Salmonella enterica TaxID=28901 RepID=UPI00398C486A
MPCAICRDCNVSHASLKAGLVYVVKGRECPDWVAVMVTDALRVLLSQDWDGEGQTTLIQTIQE